MKLLKLLSLVFIFATVALTSCSKEDDSEEEEEQVLVNEFSIIPSTTLGRPNETQGCVEIFERQALIEVWDHATIDGDIVSIIANGETIIDEQMLDGPGNKISVNYDFGYNGFNSLVLYAHNLGSLYPNTAAISVNGVEFVLEAYLETNGAIDIVVTGYGVTCADAGQPGGGGGGGGGTSDAGDISFWIKSDFGCGNISVTLEGVGTGTISNYIPGGTPDCGDSGTLNFADVPYGSYNFTASCGNLTWSGSIDLNNTCSTMELTL